MAIGGSVYQLKYKPNTKFVFQSGLRFNHVTSEADFTENNEFLNLPFTSSKNNAGALTGTAGLTWSPNEIMQWKLNAASLLGRQILMILVRYSILNLVLLLCLTKI